jgi:chromosome segregation ATPase
VNELGAQIKDLVATRDRAESRWRTEYDDLAKVQKTRVQWRDWYADQLKILEDGSDRQNQAAKVRALTYDKDKNLMMDGQEVLKILDKEAEPINQYVKKIEDLYKEIKTVQDEILDLLKKEEELGIEINGKEGVRLGLRHDLDVAEKALKNALDEQNQLAAEVYTARANAELLKKRRLALETRLKELQGVAAALGQ